MEIKEIIGIDISKSTLDGCLHTSGLQEVFDNGFEGIADLVGWSLENSKVGKENLLFVFEHTGLYAHQPVQYLIHESLLFHVVPGLEVKRSLGIARGKNDKADAKRIALYGFRVREEVTPYQMPSATLAALKRLMSPRRKLVAQRAGHLTTLGEQQRVLGKTEGGILFEVQ